jgi:tRNA(Arg) A34 adenosine deaminase TadA
LEIDDAKFVTRLIDVIDQDIVPLTRDGVSLGNKIFGAAILSKADLSLVIAGTNNEIENPLWHGEVHTLKQFYELPRNERPLTSDCIFLSTHEPCSLCLSAITWAGFDNFYYLFGYNDTKDSFNIPHDLKILNEVFGIEDGNYARSNAYWRSQDITALVDSLPAGTREPQQQRINEIGRTYTELSDSYQASKGTADIPMS